MKQRWSRLRSTLGRVVPQAEWDQIFNHLEARYTEPHRHYHTLTHIEHCLGLLDEVRQLVLDPNAVELAIWFHDAIYDTKRSDNEQRSAELFYSVLGKRLSKELAERVEFMIVATKSHQSADPDTQTLLGIDLSILGQGSAVYSLYSAAIRREYQWVQWWKYKIGRSKVLKHFLRQERIFASQYFYDQYEHRARVNLQRELRGMTFWGWFA